MLGSHAAFLLLLSCAAADWPSWSGPEPQGSPGLSNWRFAEGERLISPANVGQLGVLWRAKLDGYSATTPTVVDGLVYVTDFGGGVACLDAATGLPVWKRKFSSFTDGSPDDNSRSAPLVVGSLVILGQYGLAVRLPTQPAPLTYLVALDRFTGDLVWRIVLDRTGYGVIHSSPVVYDDLVFVGVSSIELYYAAIPVDQLISRGQVYAIFWETGEIAWHHYTVPEGWAGAQVWGSGFSLDAARGHLYVPTGNLYDVPPELEECEIQRPLDGPSCVPPGIDFDSIIALDLRTGARLWAFRAIPWDAYAGSCSTPPFTNCADPRGPDFDFGSAPILFTTNIRGESRDALGAGSKSGWFFAIDRNNGTLLWRRQVEGGGLVGGIEFGSAFDGERFYVPAANSFNKPTIVMNSTDPTITKGSLWTALDPHTGSIVWQTAEPYNLAGANINGLNLARCSGPPTAANGVVFASSSHPTSPNFFALDSRNGAILWEFFCGGSAMSGPAVVDGVVYWTCGYAKLGLAYADELFAFSLPRELAG